MKEEDFVNRLERATSRRTLGIMPLLPGSEPVRCHIRGGHPPCGIGAHGFICHFQDGTCLRHTLPAEEDEMKP